MFTSPHLALLLLLIKTFKKAPDGADFKLIYTADERGFIAEGSHLPKPVAETPEVLAARAKHLEAVKEAEEIEILQKKINQFAPIDLTADISFLEDSEKQALDQLIAAAKLLNPVFNLQAWAGYPLMRQYLSKTPGEHKSNLI